MTLSWWALFAGRVRFHDVEFYRPELELRRGADGLIYLADKPLNAAGPTTTARSPSGSSRSRASRIHDATLAWRDEMVGAPEVRLTRVEIAMRKHLGHHRAALTACRRASSPGASTCAPT